MPVGPYRQHLLVLDDDAPLVMLFTRWLRERGYRVTFLTSSHAALELLGGAAIPFDLVLTDYNMPGATGLDVARHCAQRFPALPVLLFSGCLTDELCSAAMAAGVRCVLDKPQTPLQLIDAIRWVLPLPAAAP